MSVFRDLVVPCPNCGHRAVHTVAVSLHAPRVPHLVDEILAGRFQRVACPACGRHMVIDQPMSYIDFERRLFFGVYPRRWLPSWRALEAELGASFHASMVEHAPALLQQMAPSFMVRAVFGLASLRDKLVGLGAALDDVALEALKLDLVRERPGELLHDDVQLCLGAVTEEVLHFEAGARSPMASGLVPVELTVPRARLDAVAYDPAWKPLYEQLQAGAFVDMRRLLVDGGAPRP